MMAWSLKHTIATVGSWRLVGVLKDLFVEEGVRKGGQAAAGYVNKPPIEHLGEYKTFRDVTLPRERGKLGADARRALLRRQHLRMRRLPRTYCVRREHPNDQECQAGKHNLAPYKYGDEDAMSRTIAEAVWGALQEPGEREDLLDRLVSLGKMSDEEFDEELEGLQNAGPLQSFRRVREELEAALPGLQGRIRNADAEVAEALDNATATLRRHRPPSSGLAVLWRLLTRKPIFDQVDRPPSLPRRGR
jgi:hypothetical protein